MTEEIHGKGNPVVFSNFFQTTLSKPTKKSKPRFSSLCCRLVLLAGSLTEATTLEFVSLKKWGPGPAGSLRSLDLASMGPLSLKTLDAQMQVKTAHIYLAMDHPCMNVD